MNGFFKSIKTCGALFNKVRAVLGEICRNIAGAESVVARVFTSAKTTDTVRPIAPVVSKAPPGGLSPDLAELVGASAATLGETREKSQSAGCLPPVAVCGPACRMEVALGYVPPARGMPVLLRLLERV